MLARPERIHECRRQIPECRRESWPDSCCFSCVEAAAICSSDGGDSRRRLIRYATWSVDAHVFARSKTTEKTVARFRPNLNKPSGRSTGRMHGTGPSGMQRTGEASSCLVTEETAGRIQMCGTLGEPAANRSRHTLRRSTSGQSVVDRMPTRSCPILVNTGSAASSAGRANSAAGADGHRRTVVVVCYSVACGGRGSAANR